MKSQYDDQAFFTAHPELESELERTMMLIIKLVRKIVEIAPKV